MIVKTIIIMLARLLAIAGIITPHTNDIGVIQVSEKSIKKDLSPQYKLEAERISYCKNSSGKTQIHVRFKFRFNNLSANQAFIYPITEKRVTNILIYKNIENLKGNKPDTGANILRVHGSLLKKPIGKMEAADLYQYFTIIGPFTSFEEHIDYVDVPESEEPSLQSVKSYYMRIFFEAHIPIEVEELIMQQMKQFNPTIVESIMSEPILIETKEINNLQPCP